MKKIFAALLTVICIGINNVYARASYTLNEYAALPGCKVTFN